jgi:hypothetical protein
MSSTCQFLIATSESNVGIDKQWHFSMAITIFTTRTAHVPAQFLPCQTTVDRSTLEAIFFVRFIGEISEPVLKRMGKGEAAARLFTNALNPSRTAERDLMGRSKSYQGHAALNYCLRI